MAAGLDDGQMFTEDENLVEFIYKVQYRVSSAQDFVFKVRTPEATVQLAAESALRESVGTNQLDAVLEGGHGSEISDTDKTIVKANPAGVPGGNRCGRHMTHRNRDGQVNLLIVQWGFLSQAE